LTTGAKKLVASLFSEAPGGFSHGEEGEKGRVDLKRATVLCCEREFISIPCILNLPDLASKIRGLNNLYHTMNVQFTHLQVDPRSAL